MKLKLLLSLFLFVVTLSLSKGFAQDNKAYAITGSGNGDFEWMNIRQIDLATGSVSNNIYERGKTNFQLLDAVSKKQISESNALNARQAGVAAIPTNLVAAAAFDQKHNKLFFSPMALGELRWLDLSSGLDNLKFYTIQSALLNPGVSTDEANHFTRMTIGADGNGYALSNDGNHLVKFTTGKKVVITDLGSLVDASANSHISVHNKCSSWGGDIIADAYGKLYLFTATKNIFKIDIDNRIATYVGAITGLSGAYTVNGAAVDKDDNVVISSANTFEGFYKVSMKDLAATKLNTTGQVYNSSDLANANLLYASQLRTSVGTAQLVQREIIGNEFISIYPNPVMNSQFKVTFDKSAAGTYTVALTDIQGKLIMNKEVFVKSTNQVEQIQLKTKPAGGIYLIKISDVNKKTVFADKIVVE